MGNTGEASGRGQGCLDKVAVPKDRLSQCRRTHVMLQPINCNLKGIIL